MKEATRNKRTTTSQNARFELNGEQKEAKRLILENQLTVVTGMAGCLGLGTEVLMYDGSFKKVEDVIVGDRLMGPDSTPRTVLSLCRGVDQMYWVRQNRGIDYRVNSNHILSLKKVNSAIYRRITVNGTRKFDYTKPPIHEKEEFILNIKLEDYLKLNSKKQIMGYVSDCLQFEEKPLLIDPYYLGLWLGDGSKNCIRHITTADSEISNYLIENGAINNTPLGWSLPTDADFNESFKFYFSISNASKLSEKFIPKDYILNSKENRLKLLAGLLDSDGYYVSDGKYYEIIAKNKRLADDITFLCRSLGYKTHQRDKTATMKRNDGTIYSCVVQRISIMTEDIIPVLIERKKNELGSDFKNRKHTGITIEKDIIDNYYGFTLDGDHLFLLKDLTVTHNSGKSLICAEVGLDLLIRKQYEKILVCRAAIEVGKTLGNLPGNLADKFNPYIEGFVENLNKLCEKERVKEMVNRGLIEGVPIQFIRGKTVDDYLVCEEAQNLTKHEMLAILTRLGKTGKMVINGDNNQQDIRCNGEMNGLQYIITMAKSIPEIKVINLLENHRSGLVGKILDYEYGLSSS